MAKIRILYIEDDEFQRHKLTLQLENLDYSVLTADSGTIALHLFEKENIDIVLCDLNLPDISGIDILKKIKKSNSLIPIILISGRGTLTLAVDAMREGANHFLQKPIDIEELHFTLQNALERFRLQKRLNNSVQMLNLITETVPDVIYSLNLKGEFISISKAAEAVLGYKPEEMLGHSVFKIIHPDDRNRVFESFQRSMATQENELYSIQFRMMSKSGETKDFEIKRRLIIENGKIVRSDGIARDISDRKEFERKLKEHSQELEKKVEFRTEKLSYANRQLVALNAVANKFTRIYDEDVLLKNVAKLLTSSLDFDRAVLFLKEGNGLKLHSFCFEKDSPEYCDKFIKMISTKEIIPPPHLQESLDNNKTILLKNLDKDPQWYEFNMGELAVKSLIAAPISVKGELIGVLEGDMQYHNREIDDQDVTRFEMFVNMVGLALDNIRAYQTLEKKVEDRTKSLKLMNERLTAKAKQLEKASHELSDSNVGLLKMQEDLEKQNKEMEKLLTQLSKSRDELRGIIDTSPNVIMMVNNDGIITSLNQQLQDYFNLDVNKVMGLPFFNFTSEISGLFEDQDKFLTIINKLVKRTDIISEKDVIVENLHRRALKLISPRLRYISIFSVPVFDKENIQEIGRVWTFADVTKFKQMDEQLHAIVEVSPIPFIISKVTDGKILYANEPLAELLGMNVTELLGKNTPDFYVEQQDREILLASIKKKGYIKDYEVRIRRADGNIIWMILSVVTTNINDEPVLVGALYDINERRKAEEALKVSEERFRSLVENALDIIYSVKPDGNYSYLSPQFSHLTGYKASEFIGKTLDSIIHPDDLRLKNKPWEAKKNYPDDDSDFEYRVKHKDGSWRWFVSHATNILNDQGEIIERIGIAHDVTEMKAILNNLEKTNQELRTTQGQLVQSEKMAALGMLVAGIAHEINTPVGAISSMHNTLIRAFEKLKKEISYNFEKKLSEEKRYEQIFQIMEEANKVIQSGTERVTNIVRRLRSFARLDEAELKDADIQEGLEDTLTLIHHEIKHGIEIEKNYGKLSKISCFPGRLNQVFLNILINAKQAIKAKRKTGKISITTFEKEKHIYVQIEDNGIGISKKNIDKIFDPGFTTKGVGVGTGLGLSIVYQIIQDHLGEIKVESEINKGTTFTIKIPTDLDQRLENT